MEGGNTLTSFLRYEFKKWRYVEMTTTLIPYPDEFAKPAYMESFRKTLMDNIEKYQLKFTNVFIAGGALRDALFDIIPKDVDVFLTFPEGMTDDEKYDELNLLYGCVKTNFGNIFLTEKGDHNAYRGTADPSKVFNVYTSVILTDLPDPKFPNDPEERLWFDVDLILRPEKTIEEVIGDFDYDLVRFVYDVLNDKYVTTEEAVYCFTNKSCTFSKAAYERASRSKFMKHIKADVKKSVQDVLDEKKAKEKEKELLTWWTSTKFNGNGKYMFDDNQYVWVNKV